MVARLEASHLVEDAKRKDVIFANSITRQGAHEYSGNKRIVQHFVISKYNTIKCEEANQQTTTQLSLICWTSLHPTFFIKSYQLQYTQPFFQVQPKPMASRCSLVLLQRDSNQYLGKDHDSHGSWGIMWPTCVENFDMAIFWFERRLLACCWCMARCFEGKLDICVVGKLGRETLPLKDFLQFFFLSLSSELFSFIEGMPEISHGNSKVPYLNRKYIPVYTFFQTIINSCFSFP